MKFYAILIADNCPKLHGPFDTETMRDQTVGLRLFDDDPMALVVRLDLHDGELSISSPQNSPDIVLFKQG